MSPRRLVVSLAGTITALALMLITLSMRSAAQAPTLDAKYFSSYARAHRVTISRNGGVLTTFDIPAGVYLSVYSDQPRVQTGQDGRVEFHGRVEIRTLPRSEVERFGDDATQMMARAPLVIAAQNVDVLSETVIP